MGDELEMDDVTSTHAAARVTAHAAVRLGTARALVEEAEQQLQDLLPGQQPRGWDAPLVGAALRPATPPLALPPPQVAGQLPPPPSPPLSRPDNPWAVLAQQAPRRERWWDPLPLEGLVPRSPLDPTGPEPGFRVPQVKSRGEDRWRAPREDPPPAPPTKAPTPLEET